MITIEDRRSLSSALTYLLDKQLACLLFERQRQLGGDIEGIAQFVVLQAIDRPTQTDKALGFSLFQNVGDGTRWKDPDYSPGFEFIKDHGFAYELAFQFTDDFTHVVFVENAPGMHSDFLSFCQQYASQHA